MEESTKNDKNSYKPLVGYVLFCVSIISLVIVGASFYNNISVALPLSLIIIPFIFQTVALFFENQNLTWREMKISKKVLVISHIVSIWAVVIGIWSL